MMLTRRGQQAASVTGVGISTSDAAPRLVGGDRGRHRRRGRRARRDARDGEGYSETLRRTGSADTAIVLRGASAAEVSSVLTHDNAIVIAQAPGIAKDDEGKPIASPELVVAANLPMKGGNPEEDFGSVQLRGIGDEAWKLRTNVKIVAGRKFTPGLRELVAGKGAQRQFDGLDVDHEIKLGNQMWKVVGIFESKDAMDSELWGDADVVGPDLSPAAARVRVRCTCA